MLWTKVASALEGLTLPMWRLLSSKTECKDFYKPSKPCHVGTHLKALTEYSQMSTHFLGFQSFFRFFALFCIGQISHQQHKGNRKTRMCLQCRHLIPALNAWAARSWYRTRVLARISKMPVQNSNSKNSAHPDLAIYLLQILVTTFNNILCWKGQFKLQLCPRRCLNIWLLPSKSPNWKFFIENFACPERRFSGNYLSKRQAGWVLAESLESTPDCHPVSWSWMRPQVPKPHNWK